MIFRLERVNGIIVGYLDITSSSAGIFLSIAEETFKVAVEYIPEADFLGTCPVHLSELHFSWAKHYENGRLHMGTCYRLSFPGNEHIGRKHPSLKDAASHFLFSFMFDKFYIKSKNHDIHSVCLGHFSNILNSKHQHEFYSYMKERKERGTRS